MTTQPIPLNKHFEAWLDRMRNDPESDEIRMESAVAIHELLNVAKLIGLAHQASEKLTMSHVVEIARMVLDYESTLRGDDDEPPVATPEGEVVR